MAKMGDKEYAGFPSNVDGYLGTRAMTQEKGVAETDSGWLLVPLLNCSNVCNGCISVQAGSLKFDPLWIMTEPRGRGAQGVSALVLLLTRGRTPRTNIKT